MSMRYHDSHGSQHYPAFLKYLAKVRQRTMRVVACIPHDKIEWRAAPDKFTHGDLARHIAATERNIFVECACGGSNRYAGCRRGWRLLWRAYHQQRRSKRARSEALNGWIEGVCQA